MSLPRTLAAAGAVGTVAATIIIIMMKTAARVVIILIIMKKMVAARVETMVTALVAAVRAKLSVCMYFCVFVFCLLYYFFFNDESPLAGVGINLRLLKSNHFGSFGGSGSNGSKSTRFDTIDRK